MAVSLEPLVTIIGTKYVWIARFGYKHTVFGDPYTGSMIVVRKEDTAHILAHTGELISRSERNQLGILLREQSIDKVKWQRRYNSDKQDKSNTFLITHF